MKFTEKTVLCNTEDVHRVLQEVELEWVKALLLRLKLDSKKISAIMDESSDYGNQAWRDYLVVENNITINRKGAEITIEKHFEEKPKVLLGKWKKPEIVRVKDGDKYHVELRLDYWQLI